MKILQHVLFSILTQSSCHAAVAILDVHSPWGGTKDFYFSYGQTFSPGFDGTLAGLRLYVTSSSPLAVTIWEFDSNTGHLGNILGMQAATFSRSFSGSYGWAEVSFQRQIPQFQSAMLAFTVSSANGPAPGPAISDRGYYSGGSFFEFTTPDLVTLTSRDLTFQTLVIPIPEPSLPILVGSAAILLSFVRKRGVDSRPISMPPPRSIALMGGSPRSA